MSPLSDWHEMILLPEPRSSISYVALGAGLYGLLINREKEKLS